MSKLFLPVAAERLEDLLLRAGRLVNGAGLDANDGGRRLCAEEKRELKNGDEERRQEARVLLRLEGETANMGS